MKGQSNNGINRNRFEQEASHFQTFVLAGYAGREPASLVSKIRESL